MRKRISCKIIRSVPLGERADKLQNAGKPKAHHANARGVASLTYNGRLVVTRTSMDYDSAARTFDFNA
ncbi:MAG: hypothetical protein AMJ65_06355 [Phycisphaerae bacterium SG8_4]|nr:MAG: hypothetical protein AMJ65_06355 [Phycisphaerae bacterium SG8_4]